MAIPNSYIRRFVISDVAFMHYYAQDAHGTVVNNYVVNGEDVCIEDFYAAIQKAVGDAEYYIQFACGMIKHRTPDWSKKS
ncbi:hypothetical protein DEEACLCL_00101 [Salmonella phage CRW-SP2]|nr:hypothetical protein DEEACLCL_00101 [Salmonella phage CRW-SP2]